MGKDGKILSCTRGEPSDQPSNPPEPSPEDGRNKEKLVRIGSNNYGKSTHTERKFNIGFRVEKAPGGVAFRNQNKLVVDKQPEYRLLKGRLPTCPGESPREASDGKSPDLG